MDKDLKIDENLEQAIQEENLDLVKMLLEEGISLNTWNKNHCTPLFSAVAKKNIEMVRLFLEKGANVNHPNRYNLGTPLQCACQVGRCDFVKLLLENGAEVNFLSGTSKSTALFVASEKGDCDIVEVLLANRAEVNLPNDKNEIPLDVACQNGHVKVVKTLLDNGAYVNWSGKWEGTPLLYACEKNNYNIVKTLLDRGANMNPIGINSPLHTPLYHAALHGYTRVVKLLLQRGADVNWPSGNVDTALHAVCFKGHSALAEVLLGMGAEVNRPSIDGKSPLFIACAAGNSTIIRLLLERGADVDTDIDGAFDLSWHTPLYMSLRQGHREMISVLLNKDIDMFYPYDMEHPMGKTISEVRSYLYYSKIMSSGSSPLNVTGKFCSNHIIKKHLTKLKIAGLSDHIILEEKISGKFIAELEHIKSFNIFHDVTLDIVFRRTKNPFYLRNQSLLNSIEDCLYSPCSRFVFPSYVHILRNTLEKSKRRLSLLSIASNVLERLECLHKLPVLVLEIILLNLDEEDLKNISNLK